MVVVVSIHLLVQAVMAVAVKAMCHVRAKE